MTATPEGPIWKSAGGFGSSSPISEKHLWCDPIRVVWIIFGHFQTEWPQSAAFFKGSGM